MNKVYSYSGIEVLVGSKYEVMYLSDNYAVVESTGKRGVMVKWADVEKYTTN